MRDEPLFDLGSNMASTDFPLLTNAHMHIILHIVQ